MNITECQVGQRVYFGRSNGEKTLGEIVKVNRAKLKIKTLEDRGTNRAYAVGTVWTVPPTLCTPADSGRPARVTGQQPERQVLDYTHLSKPELLRKMQGIYSQLSPENLSCDGELSRTAMLRRARRLNTELLACFRAFGREVSEMEACGL